MGDYKAGYHEKYLDPDSAEAEKRQFRKPNRYACGSRCDALRRAYAHPETKMEEHDQTRGDEPD
jgi:hypothetical protein